MSLNVFLKIRSSDVSRYFRSHAMLEFLESLQHREEPEVHRAHVERRDLGLELQRRLETLLDRHRRSAAGREVEHDVRPPLDLGREFAEEVGILRGTAVDRITRVQMHDRSTRLRGADRSLGDFLRRHRKVGRHRRRVNAAGHGAGDDDFAAVGHGVVLSWNRVASRLCCRNASRRASRQRMRASRSSALRGGSSWLVTFCTLAASHTADAGGLAASVR